jgi:hypothetical protein
MPATSKKQWRLMQMLAHNKGQMNNAPDMSPEKAAEYTKANTANMSYKSLPEQAPKKKKFRVLGAKK